MRFTFLLLAMIGVSGCGVHSYYTYAPPATSEAGGEFVVYRDTGVTSTVSVVMYSDDASYSVYPSFSRGGSRGRAIKDVNVRLSWSERGKSVVVPPSAFAGTELSTDRYAFQARLAQAPPIPKNVDDLVLTLSFTLDERRISKDVPLKKERHSYFWIFRDC